MVPNRKPVLDAGEEQTFPFGPEFQTSLFRLLCEDSDFGHTMVAHLQPWHFENEVLAWGYAFLKQFHDQYGSVPSVGILKEQINGIDASAQPLYHSVVESIANAPLGNEQWLRDKVLDFVKRNVFVRAFHDSRDLYNSGKITEAYDLMMEQMDKIQRTAWEPRDEEFFFDALAKRHTDRWKEDLEGEAVPTGLAWLDDILDGGLSKGELGAWIAYAKHGKSTMLVNHGVGACRAYRTVAHFVFEGSRKMVANRYDAAFMDEYYGSVKRGDISEEKYHRVFHQYQQMKGKMVLRGFVKDWNYSVVDIDEALKDLRRRGFIPDLVIVDYGDLIGGRAKSYPNEREKQKDAFRDLKLLANRGYAIWTASQAQRPDNDNTLLRPYKLQSRNIADCYEKVRVSDFIGSLNMSKQERRDEMMRIYAELYRDNEADKELLVRAQLSHMIIKQEPGIEVDWPHLDAGLKAPPTGSAFGYQNKPVVAPVNPTQTQQVVGVT